MILNTDETIDKVVENVDKILCLDNYINSECIEKARRLKQVVIGLIKICQLHPFLTIFAHSSSCTSSNCGKLCHIFRYMRYHIQHGVSAHISTSTSTEHTCAIINIYGQILRMHVDTCVEDMCGIPSCKDIKKIREEKGHRVLPINFKRNELILRNSVILDVIHPNVISPDDVINGIAALTL